MIPGHPYLSMIVPPVDKWPFVGLALILIIAIPYHLS